MFKEHQTCDKPGTCEFMEMCMSALTIKLVTRQVEQKIEDNPYDLQSIVSETCCRHADAKKILKSAERLLDKQPPK